MPPVLSRKRLQSDSPTPDPPPKRARARKQPERKKETVFQTLDAPPKAKRTLAQTKALLEQEDDESSLSELDSSDDEFEDVPLNGTGKSIPHNGDESEESQDEDWEDALGAHHHNHPDPGPVPVISGDIALTLSAAPKTAFDTKPDGKKGPSKVQRQIRNATHCMHVQYLMFHNLIRNSWIQDKGVQKSLVEALPTSCWREIERYWREAGISDGPSRVIIHPPGLEQDSKETKASKGKWKESGKKGVKVFESPQPKQNSKAKSAGRTPKGTTDKSYKSEKTSRDWSTTSELVEADTINLSAGDPLHRLLRYLAAYWKSKFRVTYPSLRKRGYL